MCLSTERSGIPSDSNHIHSWFSVITRSIATSIKGLPCVYHKHHILHIWKAFH